MEDKLKKIETLTGLLKVVQEGYVKPDQNKEGANTTGIVRDAKEAKRLYGMLLVKLEEVIETL